MRKQRIHRKVRELLDYLGLDLRQADFPGDVLIQRVPEHLNDCPAFFISGTNIIYYSTRTNVEYPERSWIILHEVAHAVFDQFPVKMPEALEEHCANMMAVGWCTQFGIPISDRFVDHMDVGMQEVFVGEIKSAS